MPHEICSKRHFQCGLWICMTLWPTKAGRLSHNFPTDGLKQTLVGISKVRLQRDQRASRCIPSVTILWCSTSFLHLPSTVISWPKPCSMKTKVMHRRKNKGSSFLLPQNKAWKSAVCPRSHFDVESVVDTLAILRQSEDIFLGSKHAPCHSTSIAF